jgi:hypothetical protein
MASWAEFVADAPQVSEIFLRRHEPERMVRKN